VPEVTALNVLSPWQLLATVALLLMGIGAADSHHSATMYDAAKFVTLRGTLQRVQLSNPHSWFWLVVPNDHGDGDVWAIEGGSVAELVRRWGPNAKDDLTIGQKITISIHPLKDGRMSGQLVNIILESGKVLRESTTGSGSDAQPGSYSAPVTPR
jgi:hypothetical protein